MLTLWPPGSARTEGVDAKILGLDLNVDFVGFRQHGDRRRGRVNPAAGFGGRHALHAMHAAFVLQPAVDALTLDVDDHFLEAALAGLAERHHLELPPLTLGVTAVHAIEIAGEERRLLATGAGADFDDDVLIVVGILWQQQDLELAHQLIAVGVEAGQLLFRERAHLGICALGQLLGLRDFVQPRPLYSRNFSTSGSISESAFACLRYSV